MSPRLRELFGEGRSGAARAGRALRPALSVVTPLGWSVMVAAVVAWILAGALGWVEMAVVATALLVLAVVAALFTIGRTRISISTVVEPRRVTAGDPLTGELRARNDTAVPLTPLTVEFPIGAGGVSYDLPLLLGGQEHAEVFVVPTQRRGVITVGPVTTVRGDPIGLFRRTQERTERTEVFVHPVVVPLDSFGVGLVRDLEGNTAQAMSASDLAFHALREYAPGDDLRHIHWRSSARHGQLLVRQFLDTRRSHLVVIVDADPSSYGSEGEYETAMSVAASLLRRGLLDGYDASFVSGEVMTVRGEGRAALDGCARAVPSAPGQGVLEEAAARGAQAAPDASLVVIVTGAHPAYVALQRAAGRFGVDAVKGALRVQAGDPPGVRTDGDLPVMTIGRLEELALVLPWGLR
jgi:uncharacterized protein (DUF58 family)